MQISIDVPTDSDGFIYVQCPSCDLRFKLTPSDYQDDTLTTFWCPDCGLSAGPGDFVDEAVLEAAHAEAINFAKRQLNQLLRGFQQSARNNKFLKVTTTPFEESPVPRVRTLSDQALISVPCCDKTIKAPFGLGASLFYCPFCGQVQT